MKLDEQADIGLSELSAVLVLAALAIASSVALVISLPPF